MLRSFRSAVVASFLLAMAGTGTGLAQAETLCSLPPVTYTKAKTTYPASASAIQALEKFGIATWYSDRTENGDYAKTAADLVSSCSEDSRISVVVYGLPNKDCAAKESAVGSTVHSASDYVSFLNTLTSAIGNRKVLYILEPDAIGLLADTTGCGQSAGYLANLQTAIGLLSKNDNAEIYLDVGYWTLQYPATSTAVAVVVKQLASASSMVKGITLNTSNYQSTSTLSTLCSNFQTAVGSTDLHCIFDTSRNYHGGPESNEWCNVKSAGIGPLPTSDTGISNVDYFIWAKPPGDSDGTCEGRTADSMQGPGAGVFFNELFQNLWNQGIMVAEKGYSAIDGTSQQHQQQGQEAATYNATVTSSKAGDTNPATTSTSSNPVQSTGDQGQTTTQDASTPMPVPAAKSSSSNSQQISTESSNTSTVGTGIVVLIALVAAAVVAIVAIVGVRRRQNKMLSDAKTPELAAMAPLPTAMVNFRPQRTALARDPSVL
ncbi:hypothetical protein PF008_g27670 [Phytophthora fragariae]|uniref:Glycoside hydrolase family 6 protein n=1 Tax=Phytophthora fragariae TaxID=53985 RepID=A0A6G0QE78_9STRA|nr:hypothetical protein PF008_g27670 [Phytophthora fragariae]